LNLALISLLYGRYLGVILGLIHSQLVVVLIQLMSLLRGRIYNRSKKAVGAPEGNQNRAIQNGQNVQIESQATHETLGDRFGVSGKTVQRDGKFAQSVEVLEEYVPGISERVMSGEVKRRDVNQAVKMAT
jgi:hypothetical protein